MPFIEQKPRTADFLLSEANGSRSRETGEMAPTTTAIYAGQLLALNADGRYIPFAGKGDEPDSPVKAVGVLYANVPASEQPQAVVVIKRDAEVAGEPLLGLDADATTDLQDVGVIVRP
ncbi:head decoration protein [Alcaligenes sp. PF14]|uniref:head decoration protein n=1 Tax=Alcaligenes sp. PF14 TaxID=3120297 RepID=UPI0030186E9C